MKTQIEKPYFRQIFKEAFQLTWRHKLWWLLGFFALLISSSFSYQVVSQGVSSLTNPIQWWKKWQLWAAGTSPIELFTAQWGILLSDPAGWFRAVFVWTIVLAFAFALLALCIYSIITVISIAKLKQINGMESLLLAVREAKTAFWGVLWAFILAQLVINALILVFSIPVISFGGTQNIFAAFLLYGFFVLFVLCAIAIAALSFYTILFIVIEEEKLANALILSWALLKRHWVITLEMFLLQTLVGIGVVLLLSLLVSLITIPVTIIGVILVSQQLFDITASLPKLTLFVLTLLTFIGISAYSMFNLYSWTFLFMRFKEIHPKSRIAAWIEIQMLSR